MSKTIDKWTVDGKGTYELLEEEGFPSSRELFLDGQMIMSDEEEIHALYDRVAQLAEEVKLKVRQASCSLSPVRYTQPMSTFSHLLSTAPTPTSALSLWLCTVLHLEPRHHQEFFESVLKHHFSEEMFKAELVGPKIAAARVLIRKTLEGDVDAMRFYWSLTENDHQKYYGPFCENCIARQDEVLDSLSHLYVQHSVADKEEINTNLITEQEAALDSHSLSSLGDIEPPPDTDITYSAECDMVWTGDDFKELG